MILLNGDGKSNLHTHTKYCDGKDSPEEIVIRAIDLGFNTIGFSGHEYSKLDKVFCMSKKKSKVYQEEISALKEKYKEQIRVLLGVERDYYGHPDGFPYDYVIGSLHYVKQGNTYLTVDYTEMVMRFNVHRYFNRDYMAYVRAYYETIPEVLEKTGGDIVGHFDLITKFNEGGKYFDENSQEYRNIALSALRKTAKNKPIFEINTGAMARGYRTEPYPAKFLIDELNHLGCPMIMTSDCHDAEYLNYGFEMVANP